MALYRSPECKSSYTHLRHEDSKDNLIAGLGRNILKFFSYYIEKYVNVKSTSIKLFMCVLQLASTRALLEVQRGSVKEHIRENILKSGWARNF